MRMTLFAVLIGAATVVSATGAEACSRNVSAKATNSIVPSDRIDQSLLSAAVRVETNFHRCRAGLSKLKEAPKGMSKQSLIHSSWMAKTHNLDHKNTVRGSKSLQQRVKSAGVRKVRAGAENIGMVHRYQIDNKHFKILNSSACEFSTYEGQPLPAHTYATLARHIVDLWMNSPGHRKNILNKSVKQVTTAVAFDPNAQYCGRYWMTQAFIG